LLRHSGYAKAKEETERGFMIKKEKLKFVQQIMEHYITAGKQEN